MHQSSPKRRTIDIPASVVSGRRHVKRAGAAAAAALSLFAAGCGIVGNDGQAEEGLAAGDYTVASVTDVTNSVVLNGQIAPVKSLSITSPVQSKVTRLAVSVGDRVQVDQFLAEMDTEELRRQIDQQEQQRAAAQAQAQPVSYRADDVNGARMVHAAEVRTMALPSVAPGFSPLSDLGSTILPAIEKHVPGLSHVLGGPVAPQPAPPQGEPAPSLRDAAPSDQRLEQLQQAQQRQQAAQAQAAQQQAAQQQAAQVQAAQQQAAQQQAAQQQMAQQQLQAQAAPTGSDGSLEYQVQQSTIYAPMAGIVTSVDVQEGDIPQGKILTIADDSRLLIRSEVREADVASIKPGDRVTFTSTATGDKPYSGRVGKIAPVASAKDKAESGSGGGSVMFPIEIEVEGDKEGLLLGGTVRAEVITEETPQALSVPRDAVADGTVLVLSTGNGGREGTVEERTVETGAANEVDIAVTGGELKPGDIVINWPDKYRDKVGQKVAIDDPKFDPSQVEQARNSGRG